MNSNKKTDSARHTALQNGPPIIGLVADDIVMVGGQNALLGASDVARERDVNLICFHQTLPTR